MLYVYGIVDSCRFETIPGYGHEGRDIVPVPSGTLAAAASVLSACAIGATPQNVWRHERVLERLMQDHAVLPLRFGTICRDADALKECLLYSSDGLVNDLERVRGKVEIALRVVEDDRRSELPGRYLERDCISTTDRQFGEAAQGILNAPGKGRPGGRGAAYLRTRVQRAHREMARDDSGKRLEQLLRHHLELVAKDVVCALPADGSAGFLLSCLVERNRVPAFGDTLDHFCRDHPQFDVTCTGPWAPYSFVAAAPLSGRQQ